MAKKSPLMLLAAMGKAKPAMPPEGAPAPGDMPDRGGSDEDAAGQSAMQDLMDCLKSGDAAGAWQAFKMADKASDMMLNSEPPEAEEQPEE